MKKSFKRFAAILLGLALLATSATAAFADGDTDPAVTYDGSALTANYTDKNFAEQLFAMQPGDSKTLTVELHNNTDAQAAFSLNNSVIQSLEETLNTQAAGGAYTYHLEYQGPSGTQVLFDSQRIGGTKTNTTRAAGSAEGLNEINGAVGNSDAELTTAPNGMTYRFLDTLGARQSGKVLMTVTLDGETQGNAYQNTLASLMLRFAVDPVTSINRNETVTNRVNRDVTTVVQTGEGVDNLPFVLATGISGLILLVLGILGMLDGRKAKKAARQLACLALALTFAVAAPAMLGNVARAAEPTYTVRVFAGAQGTFTGELVAGSGKLSDDKTVWTVEVTPGSKLTINDISGHVELKVPEGETTSKYYVQGLRESGADNQAALASQSIDVNQDMDLVVAYGVVGDMVDYTVRYVDAAGNELLESETRRGKVDDKPVVPFRYIEGYLPQAYNLTMTLSANVDDNVFTFVYNPIPENVTTTTVTELVGGGVIVIPGAAAPGGPAAPAGPGGVVVPEEETPLAPPEEVIDLDNPDTPQAGPGQSGALEDLTDNATPLSGLPMAAKVGIGVAAAAVLGGAAFLIVKKRKKNNAEAS